MTKRRTRSAWSHLHALLRDLPRATTSTMRQDRVPREKAPSLSRVDRRCTRRHTTGSSLLLATMAWACSCTPPDETASPADAPSNGPRSVGEWCNGKDDDQDGVVDEGCDDDDDGYCDDTMSVSLGARCTKGDCDDTNPKIHPEASIPVDGVDHDCDGKKSYLAKLILSVDNVATGVCINGTPLPLGANIKAWEVADTYSFVMTSGPNVLGLSATNALDAKAGLVAVLEVNGQQISSSGLPPGVTYTPSHPSWNATPWRWTPTTSTQPAGDWCNAGYDASSWGPLVTCPGVAKLGEAMWWKCGEDLCDAFPPDKPRPDWVWAAFPVAHHAIHVRLEVDLP